MSQKRHLITIEIPDNLDPQVFVRGIIEGLSSTVQNIDKGEPLQAEELDYAHGLDPLPGVPQSDPIWDGISPKAQEWIAFNAGLSKDLTPPVREMVRAGFEAGWRSGVNRFWSKMEREYYSNQNH